MGSLMIIKSSHIKSSQTKTSRKKITSIKPKQGATSQSINNLIWKKNKLQKPFAIEPWWWQKKIESHPTTKKRPKIKLPNKNVLDRSPARIFRRPCCVTNIFLDQRNQGKDFSQEKSLYTLKWDPSTVAAGTRIGPDLYVIVYTVCIIYYVYNCVQKISVQIHNIYLYTSSYTKNTSIKDLQRERERQALYIQIMYIYICIFVYIYIYIRQVYYLYLIECRELNPSIFLIKGTKGLRSAETIINEKRVTWYQQV